MWYIQMFSRWEVVSDEEYDDHRRAVGGPFKDRDEAQEVADWANERGL